MLMTRAKDKNKAGKGTRKCRGMDVPISHKVAKESLTEKMIFEQKPWTSLVVQWLRLSASTAGHPRSGTKIPHATWNGQKKKDQMQVKK